MKILHTVEQYPPYIGGMAEVVKQLSEAMLKNGHEVVVATAYHPERQGKSMNGVKVVDFKITGNAVQGIRGEFKRYQEYILDNEFDVIVNFAAQQWATDLMLPLLYQVKTRKIFVPTGFSALYNLAYQEYFALVAQAMRKYDMNIFLSEEYQDIKFARSNGIENCCVIPNGAAASEFLQVYDGDIRSTLGISPDEFFILHVGSHTGLKGHYEAMEIFHRSELHNAALVIVGNKSNPRCLEHCQEMCRLFLANPKRRLDHKQVLVTELSRVNTIMAYQAADLFLFPSNIECSPIVLFECMAAKTPFLATDVGNVQEIIKWSGAGKVLPTQKDARGVAHAMLEESAQMLGDLYKDAKARQNMSESGFAAWQQHFTWEGIAKQYEEVYFGINEIVSDKNSRTDDVNSVRDGISVIIPTYNRADFIRKSIQSALQQSYPVKEILVCDDGSTDNTKAVVESIDDNRVKWLPGEHLGRPAGPRNRGIAAAQGEWLAFLDSDDEWNVEKIAKQLACVREYHTRAVCANALRFVPGQGILGKLISRTEGLISFNELLGENSVVCSSAMIHYSLISTVNGFPEEEELKALEDYALWLRIATQTDFAFTGEALVTYRDTPLSSIRAENTNNVWVQKLYILTNLLEWMPQKSTKPNYMQTALHMYQQSLTNLFREH